MKKEEFFSKHDQRIIPKLQRAVIGIAGAGGLGSNVAISLTRAGIGELIIADFDKIEPSNLNRQQYFQNQIGLPKVAALKDNLEKISPFTRVKIYEVKLDKTNIIPIFKNVDILVEAFDKSEMKVMLIETWLGKFPKKPIIAASGLAGWGKNELIHTKQIDNLLICGDEESRVTEAISPLSPRVGIIANMQANLVLELLLSKI
ncbi:MAG: sulfur carrier protein ThiS adenylyltransferase ThiF [Candidatus Cloacimonetes bacterium]|nr:sulfur carrier protein ThiS adenylyltransferase ThiF [Candidatus Cloacimonadota bacterium]